MGGARRRNVKPRSQATTAKKDGETEEKREEAEDEEVDEEEEEEEEANDHEKQLFGSKDQKKGSGFIISLRLEFYQNLVNLHEFLANVRLIDIPLLLFYLLRYLFTVGKVHKSHTPKTLTPNALKCFVGVCVLAYATRMYAISEPRWVCWDETHFGKFANHYLNRTFFLDVHPPLAKMSIAFVGHLTGYDGKFGFEKPGHQFEEAKYEGMRIYCAIMGGLCVPLAFLTVWELTLSTTAAVLGSSFILFDTGCTTLSRYILLDPILMFYVMLSIFCWVKFRSWSDCPFTGPWWRWMVATGVALGCAISVKWVGLFVILFIGASTVEDLWGLLGDVSLSLKVLGKHVCARVVGLICVPIAVYLLFFAIHFHRLSLSGSGDNTFSSVFQSGLIGNRLHNASIAPDVAYGSGVRLKNGGGAFLHSHSHVYPPEHPPEQQQITGYGHADQNNFWRIHTKDAIVDDTSPLQLVKDGDIVRLMHMTTARNLHSHEEKAPMSPNLKQVTGYGEGGEGDGNDQWKVQIVSSPGEDGGVKTVRTVFKLIHVTMGCTLGMTGKKLPKWGYEQIEVACMQPHASGRHVMWNVEDNVHKQVPKSNIGLEGPGFFAKLWESHVIMLETNNGFKPAENEFNSLPWMWPVVYRGQVFSGLDHRVYLLGNPVIWWGILGVYALYVAYYLAYEVRKKRKFEIAAETEKKSELVVKTCAWLLMGWCLHYLPFFIMGRVLYYHHYFPSFMISSMLSGILLEHLLSLGTSMVPDEEMRRKAYNAGVGVLLAASVGSFYVFRGLTYGMSGPTVDQPNASAAAYKWLDTWEI